MKSESWLRDGFSLAPRAWLPSRQQVVDALQLRLNDAVNGDVALQEQARGRVVTTMQHGLGLVVLTALVAGFLPFVVNWIMATQSGTNVAFMTIARQTTAAASTFLPAPLAAVTDTAQTIASLEPQMPGWLAAFLSALGGWIQWPLTWLGYWIVYGLGALAVAKLLGATTTLQEFYAGISFAVLPLALTGLSAIPFIGPLLALVGLGWALLIFIRAVGVVTGLTLPRQILCVALPGLGALLMLWALVGAAVATAVRFALG